MYPGMMMFLRGLTGLLLVLFYSVSAYAAPAESPPSSAIQLPEVVARVNGVDIYSKYTRFELNRVMKSIPNPLPQQQRDQIVRKIIDKEVVRELVYQEGKTLNLSVDPKLIEKELDALRENYTDNIEFEAALKERNITVDDLKRSMEVDAIAQKILEGQIKGKVKISDAEVKAYYEKNKETFHRPEAFHVRHILVAYFPPKVIRQAPLSALQAQKEEMTEAARKKIGSVLEELNSGGDFEALARKYSDDEATAQNGGDLDFVYKGVLDPAFDEAVSKLKPGETSGIVETQYGFHIIRLIETKPSEYAPFKEVEEAIQRHLYMEQAQKIVQTYVDGLRKKAEIEYLY